MKFFHSLVPGSHCSVLVLPEVYRFMDFLEDDFCIPYSVLFGSTGDTRWASVYEAFFGRISHNFTCSTRSSPSTSCVCHPSVALLCVWIWQTQASSGKYSGTFVSTAPVAESFVVLFTVPLDGCTIVATATVVTLCSSSASVLRECLRRDVVWWWIFHFWWCLRFGLGQCEAYYWKLTLQLFPVPRRYWVCLRCRLVVKVSLLIVRTILHGTAFCR